MTKTTEEILTKAIQLKPEFVDWLAKRLQTFGDMTDQLRVMGHFGQALVDMAQAELDQIKLQEDAEKPKITLAN